MALTHLLLFFISNFLQVFATPDQRIINGNVANSGQFPFVVAFHHDDEPAGRRFCGGSILNNDWVLTAAHCVVSAKTVTLYAGSEVVPGGTTMTITGAENFIIHPSFTSTNLANNVGVIKLPESLHFDGKIKRINSLGEEPVGLYVTGTVPGWGYTTDGGAYSEVLRHVSLTTISNVQCSGTFGAVYVTATTLCASGSGTAGICTGDSGGPFFTNVDGVITQIGVTSFHGAPSCLNTNPTGFQRTFDHKEWIIEVTGGVKDIPTGNDGTKFGFNFGLSAILGFVSYLLK